MKQKTALSQLEEKLDRLWVTDENFSLKLFDEITDIIELLKPIERQQIEDAFLEGYCKPENSLSDSKDYFNNNLTQD